MIIIDRLGIKILFYPTDFFTDKQKINLAFKHLGLLPLELDAKSIKAKQRETTAAYILMKDEMKTFVFQLSILHMNHMKNDVLSG